MRGRINEIRSRLLAASKGKWFREGDSVYHNMPGEKSKVSLTISYDWRSSFRREEDANFVANSRDDIEWLLEELEKRL